MSQKIALLTAMRQDLITFIDELIGILPKERDLVIMKAFARIVIMADVANYILEHLCPLEDKVINREDGYFIKNAVLFEKLQDRESQVNHFKTLWESTDDAENKEIVWEWLHHFIKLANQYSEYK